ncbi:MAG TPA: YkuS family protein [Bacillota bacterium]|nr:YkuS family protein [Bacillota bacterium]
MTKIAVDKGLDKLKYALEEKGYLVETADELSGEISAYIYNDKFPARPKSNIKEKDLDLATQLADGGYLLIRAGGREPEQIIEIIEQRLYSPLF